MKITYIMPAVGRRRDLPYPRSWLMEPLGLASLAGITPPDIDRVFHDDRLESIPYDDPTDLVAMTVETYTARRSYQIATEFRRRGVTVVLGGFHPTLMPDEAASHADAVVIGEAERIWPRLIADARAGTLRPRYAAAAHPAPDGRIADRTLFAGKRYLNLGLVETARGCRHQCDFCSIASFYRRSFTARPVRDVIAELERLPHRTIFFIDDHIAADPKRAAELFRAIIPLRIRWVGQVGLSIARNPELLRLMRSSGCIGVLIGFESLDADTLRAMRKPGRSSDLGYDEALARLRDHGLAVYGTFVFGYDTDDADSFPRTFEFALRNRLHTAAFNHLVPFPGTPVYDRLRAEGRLLHDAWWLSDRFGFGDVVFRPRHLTADRLAALCDAYRQRFFGWRSILHRGCDLRANCRTPALAALFAWVNLNGGREVRRRRGLPFGVAEEAPPPGSPRPDPAPATP